jgi:hypothetical protein
MSAANQGRTAERKAIPPPAADTYLQEGESVFWWGRQVARQFTYWPKRSTIYGFILAVLLVILLLIASGIFSFEVFNGIIYRFRCYFAIGAFAIALFAAIFFGENPRLQHIYILTDRRAIVLIPRPKGEYQVNAIPLANASAPQLIEGDDGRGTIAFASPQVSSEREYDPAYSFVNIRYAPTIYQLVRQVQTAARKASETI